MELEEKEKKKGYIYNIGWNCIIRLSIVIHTLVGQENDNA